MSSSHPRRVRPAVDAPTGDVRRVMLRWVAWLVAAVILFQAGLAGAGGLGLAGLLRLHGWLGVLVVVALGGIVGLTFVLREGWPTRTVALLSLLLAGAELALGYGQGAATSGIHVLLGLALLVLTVALALQITLRPTLSDEGGDATG